jgi:hypothetical protein
MDYVTPSACGNTGGYRRKRGHPGSCALRWRMFRRVALGRAELGSGGVAAVSPVVTSAVGRNNCGCLDDLFLFVYWRRGRFGNSG